MRVLIVDDSPVMRDRLRELVAAVPKVELAGLAASVAEAQRAILDLAPAAVILDLQLPDGNGLEVLRAAQRLSPRPKFVVLTNYASPQYRQHCLAEGASFFLDKSHDFEQIPHTLKQLTALA